MGTTGESNELADSHGQPAAHQLRPVSLNRRYFSLDVLRGAAVLGILPVNILLFGMVMAASANPTVLANFRGSEVWIWRLVHVFAEQKFMSIFSILFGAGIVLMAERAERRGANPWLLHRKRMGWLLLFGMVHAYLFWFGDILVSYALCGLVAFSIRKAKLSVLWGVSLAFIAVPSLLFVAFQFALDWLPDEVLQGFQSEWEPGAEAQDAEIAAYRGNWFEQMRMRIPQAITGQVGSFAVYTFWRVMGLMTLGMALLRSDVLTARKLQRRTYLDLFLFGTVSGLVFVAFGADQNLKMGFFYKQAMFNGMQWNYWGSIGMSLGYIGLLILLSKIRYFVLVTGALATVGRMALTNYLMQTLICTTMFYGHGFGLFGAWGREKLMITVGCIWVAQILFSVLWLRRFEQGPMERLWRRLTYGK